MVCADQKCGKVRIYYRTIENNNSQSTWLLINDWHKSIPDDLLSMHVEDWFEQMDFKRINSILPLTGNNFWAFWLDCFVDLQKGPSIALIHYSDHSSNHLSFELFVKIRVTFNNRWDSHSVAVCDSINGSERYSACLSNIYCGTGQ